MLTFREFRESSDEEGEKKALEVIRKGLSVRDDFWDDFMSLCGNVEGMSDLLGTPRDKVTALGERIRKMISELQRKDSEGSERRKVLKTGDKV